jgi:hypothetical protein
VEILVSRSDPAITIPVRELPSRKYPSSVLSESRRNQVAKRATHPVNRRKSEKCHPLKIE